MPDNDNKNKYVQYDDSLKDGTRDYRGKDGTTYTVDFSGNDGYKSDNWFRAGDTKYADAAIQYFLYYGELPQTPKDLQDFMGETDAISAKAFKNATADANTFITKNNIDKTDYYNAVKGYDAGETGPGTVDPKEASYNEYWNNLYSLEDGTMGAQMLDRLQTAEQNAALSNMALADAQYQQAAMQQAETVKAITDQVRAERMSRLRAGMNEAQIANQDMQMMLNNMNTLNTQANAMNANILNAQQQYNLAQDTAYQQYLQNATNLGNVGAAMAASDAGDAYQQTLKRMTRTGESYSTANKHVTGQTTNK